MIIALWSLCLLATFAASLGYSVRQKITLLERLDEKNKLHYLLEAGITRAIAQIRQLKKEPPKTYAALNEAWSNNSEIFQQVAFDDGTFDIGYAVPGEKPGTFKTRYGARDEESKININKADMVVLERLFQETLGYDETKAQELSACVIDWRDGDNELSIPAGSAEEDYYNNLSVPYGIKNADFQVLDELLLVRGMTPQNLSKIEDYVTIYGDGRVNINTASKVVLLALGISEDIVDKIISFRAGEDKTAGTADDNIFDVTGNIVPKLSQFYNLNDSQVAGISAVVERYLTTNSNNFMVRAEAHLNNRKYGAEAVCVINRQEKVYYWREG